MRAEVLRELNRRGPDRARGTVDEHVHARADTCATTLGPIINGRLGGMAGMAAPSIAMGTRMDKGMRTQWRRILAMVVGLSLVAIGCGNQAASALLPGSASPTLPATPSASPPGLASPSVATGSDISGGIATGGLARTYVLHLPPASTRLQPTPVVIAFHGWPMTAGRLRDVTHLSAVADAHGFAVVFAQGYEESWSVPGGLPTPAHEARIDDIAFTRTPGFDRAQVPA